MSLATRSCSVFARQALLPEGWRRNVRLEMTDGVFSQIRPDALMQPGDHCADITLPAMPSLHSHAFQRAMAGLTETRQDAADSFWTWREQMYALALRITPETMRAIAAQLYVEMLKAGFTQVAEFHYLHRAEDGTAYHHPAEMAQSVIAGACDAGIGITMLPTLYRHAGFDRPLAPEQRRFESTPEFIASIMSDLDATYRKNDRISVGVGLHSLRAVNREDMIEMLSLAPADVPVHIHIAEQQREVSDCVKALGRRPVAWLLDEVAVDQRWCLVHATHLEVREVRRLAVSGGVAGLCPVTEANLGDGLFPLQEFISAGGSFGIGTDSNVLPSANEELRLLEYGQRLMRQKRCCGLPDGEKGSVGRFLYDAALQGGARACQQGAAGLAVGQRADLCTIDDCALSLPDLEGDAILDSLVFARPAFPVRDVLCAGDWVIRDGHHRHEDAISAAFRSAMRDLRS
ncbi:formimidoylglutamate deiminase [Gluconobacter cerinus]|uniref:formimidoylglutamate deiminase n=1 Tax=Gluconobacter cerinus TaxID=38307 RepID=UPI001B8D759F|nr:formimidoylglutamate deiminase [Gluconobacter cerinus]MBS1019225.1 formimidoylglutamate deiminase [Gluconobacter cerinus]MBS1067792.1 formimidoylglutamate deiminase [Gluconobacter cerinus]